MSKKAAVQKNVLLATARAATSNATRDGKIPFGAPVSVSQLTAVQKLVTKSCKQGIVKWLGCTEKQLRDFSQNRISHSQLPAKTQERLRTVNAAYSKPWARKSATMLYTLHKSRSRSSRKPAQPAADATS